MKELDDYLATLKMVVPDERIGAEPGSTTRIPDVVRLAALLHANGVKLISFDFNKVGATGRFAMMSRTLLRSRVGRVGYFIDLAGTRVRVHRPPA